MSRQLGSAAQAGNDSGFEVRLPGPPQSLQVRGRRRVLPGGGFRGCKVAPDAEGCRRRERKRRRRRRRRRAEWSLGQRVPVCVRSMLQAAFLYQQQMAWPEVAMETRYYYNLPAIQLAGYSSETVAASHRYHHAAPSTSAPRPSSLTWGVLCWGAVENQQPRSERSSVPTAGQSS